MANSSTGKRIIHTKTVVVLLNKLNVLFPHGNEEQVERGFPDGLYPVQDRGQELSLIHI